MKIGVMYYLEEQELIINGAIFINTYLGTIENSA